MYAPSSRSIRAGGRSVLEVLYSLVRNRILGLINATIHQVVYGKYVSELAGHQISTLTFGVLVGVYAWALSSFLKLQSSGQAIGVGLMWMVLTGVFEFGLRHYVVGDS